MSNFIPMVSASPPPFDDHSFGYDDEDDDFGNFTGAGDSHESSPDPPELPPFEADHSDSAAVVKENMKNNNPLSEQQKSTNTNENANGFHEQEVNSRNTLVNGAEEECDFADFEQYDDSPEIDVSCKKPHIEKLPIQPSCENTPLTLSNHDVKDLQSKDSLIVQSETSPDNGSCDSRSPTCDDKDTVPTSVKVSRDSTTDSGMFSTDISPVPKSEDTAEFCDKSCESDNDDTFPELPRDKTESTDSPVCESYEPKFSVDSNVIANETRTSPGLDTCSSTDDCVSEGSKDDNSCLSHTKVEEEEDTVHNKDDQTVSYSSTDQQVSPLDSRDDSQALSEQNEKSSQDVSLGHVESSGQIEDEDDWGDFDLADDGLQDQDGNMIQDQGAQIEQGQVDEECIGGTSSAIADVQEEEDECLEAIEEALKDSTNTGGVDLDESDQLDVDIAAEISKNTSGICFEKDEACGTLQLQADSEPSQVECCDVLDQRTESDIDSKEHNMSTGENVCADDALVPDDTPVPCDTQVESEGFVAEEDEWNAFGEFSEAADGDDNWANFQSTSDEPTETELQPIEDGDFGDFNTAQDSKEEQKEEFGGFTSVSDKDTADDDGDWANFEDCKPNQTSQIPTKLPVPGTTASASHSKVSSEKLDHILASCFPSSGSEGMETCPSQLEVLISARPDKGTVSMHISKTTTGKARGPDMVWHSLCDLDKTSALVYQWTSSTANKHMFKTLRIDTQNILIGHKKQSVPIFASNIGLLEPIRGPVDAKPLQPKLNPTLVDPDKVDDNAGGAQELPPVEFDWDNSGLTNPLTAKTLDLDFLSVQETENVNKNTVFQSEILDAPRSSVKSLPPLEDVLKNMKVTTTTKRRREEHLSEEAGRIIDSLPILSFMTSKVLMFPLRQADD